MDDSTELRRLRARIAQLPIHRVRSLHGYRALLHAEDRYLLRQARRWGWSDDKLERVANVYASELRKKLDAECPESAKPPRSITYTPGTAGRRLAIADWLVNIGRDMRISMTSTWFSLRRGGRL